MRVDEQSLWSMRKHVHTRLPPSSLKIYCGTPVVFSFLSSRNVLLPRSSSVPLHSSANTFSRTATTCPSSSTAFSVCLVCYCEHVLRQQPIRMLLIKPVPPSARLLKPPHCFSDPAIDPQTSSNQQTQLRLLLNFRILLVPEQSQRMRQICSPHCAIRVVVGRENVCELSDCFLCHLCRIAVLADPDSRRQVYESVNVVSVLAILVLAVPSR